MGPFARFVRDEFDGPEQSDAANVADKGSLRKRFERLFEVCGDRALADAVGGFDQLFRSKMIQDGASGGERDGMRVVGEAMQERSGTSAIASTTFLLAMTAPSGAYPLESPFAVTKNVRLDRSSARPRSFGRCVPCRS